MSSGDITIQILYLRKDNNLALWKYLSCSQIFTDVKVQKKSKNYSKSTVGLCRRVK